MELNLNQITIQVKDVEQSIRFYQQLGLRLIVSALPKYARFECAKGDTTFSLHLAEEGVQASTVWIYFETDHLDDDVRTLEQQGIAIYQPPTDEPWLWREARLKDPDNHTIVLYFAGDNRKNPPWRI
jgi:predicted enzyme related to lactoylglutathione lyase